GVQSGLYPQSDCDDFCPKYLGQFIPAADKVGQVLCKAEPEKTPEHA
ncbi:unnamed protein product, partial [marine sediment metagenome]